MNHSEIVSFIWSVADLIRDTGAMGTNVGTSAEVPAKRTASFKRGKYQDVILPLTVLRRLDC